ncbi:hypothetical protein ACIG5E_13365 [Kitasatospora sp. NPDC053057]|uniref:hypothetical protein n=1 Tax=Kitasatospora sp. NPDC053057 TaxID=3364062 RepID=UPI0037C66B0A
MHNTLTDLARCLWGDEYGPTPACEQSWQHKEFYFTERLTFAGPDEILDMLRTLCPHLVDGHLPVWARNLAYRLLLLQRPDDPALMREAANSLYCHGPDWDDIAEDLTRRADALEAG